MHTEDGLGVSDLLLLLFYIIKWDIRIYVVYSRPNGWTAWAEFFCRHSWAKKIQFFFKNFFPRATPGSSASVKWMRLCCGRYMMLIDGADEVYFIDRDNCVYQVSCLTFRHRKDKNRHISDTLLGNHFLQSAFYIYFFYNYPFIYSSCYI